jgi:hypothetical protein
MASKYKKMLSLSQDALDELEALSANDIYKYNESSVVEALIRQAYALAVQTDEARAASVAEPVAA